MMKPQNHISRQFEDSFMAVDLDRQTAHCDRYELTSLFREWLPASQPILEAGCGSGRWVAWFTRQGWKACGIDWSQKLCEQARLAVAGVEFVCGDLRRLPWEGGKFGAVVSLGSIEHTVEGPREILKEFHRVLRPDGVAVITVPFLGPVRKLRRAVSRVLRRLYSSVRIHAGPSITKDVPLAAEEPGWAADFTQTPSGPEFFQYNFSRTEMRGFLVDAGFTVELEFIDFKDEGILHNAGPIAGRYDHQNARVLFTPVGRLLRLILPKRWIGHMLCYVARKSL